MKDEDEISGWRRERERESCPVGGNTKSRMLQYSRGVTGIAGGKGGMTRPICRFKGTDAPHWQVC